MGWTSAHGQEAAAWKPLAEYSLTPTRTVLPPSGSEPSLGLGSNLLAPHHIGTGRRREQAIPQIPGHLSVLPSTLPSVCYFPPQAKVSLILFLFSWLCLVQGPHSGV